MNIYEKLAAITSELNAVAKNLMVGEGRSSYKAVSEADVLAAVKPLEQPRERNIEVFYAGRNSISVCQHGGPG